MKRIAILAAVIGAPLLLFAAFGSTPFEAPDTAEATEVEFLYGPIVVQAGQANESVPAISISPWCTNCYITKIVPDMVYSTVFPFDTVGIAGQPANYNTSTQHGVWLHHDVVLDQCLRNIIAAGNERSTYQAQVGYGRYVAPKEVDSCNTGWYLNWHVHNSGTVQHSVQLKFTVTYQTTPLTNTAGIWLDVSTASDAEYTIPAGYSDTHTGDPGMRPDYTVTAAQQGQILGMGGHVHDYGISVSAYNMTRGEWICTSIAGYGSDSRYGPTSGPPAPDTGHPAAANAQTLDHDYHEPSSPDNAYHIQSMSLCSGLSARSSVVCTGDVLRLHTQYNNATSFPITDAMGIMGAYTTAPNADGDGVWDGCDTGDSDGDRYSDRVEFMVGTQPNDACADNSSDNAWPADITNDGVSDISDIDQLSANFGLGVPPAPARHDIAPDPPGAIVPLDAVVDISDLDSLAGLFGMSCIP